MLEQLLELRSRAGLRGAERRRLQLLLDLDRELLVDFAPRHAGAEVDGERAGLDDVPLLLEEVARAPVRRPLCLGAAQK